jgi:PPIC-type PPIASE domain
MRKFSIGPLVLIMAAAMIIGLLPSCSGEKEFEYDDLVLVNDEPVKLQDLKRTWILFNESQKEDYKGPDGVVKLLNELVTYKLMAQEAERRKLDQDPVFENKVKAFRESLLVKSLIDTAIDDTETMQEFQKNFIRLRLIYISYPENASNEQKKGSLKIADEAHEMVASGTDFGIAARKYSEDYSAAYGGDIGYMDHTAMKNMAGFDAAEILFSLKQSGDFSNPVEGGNGYYIFQLLEPPGKLDPRGMSPEIKNALRADKETEVVRSFSNELNSREDNNIRRNDQAIREVLQQIADEMERREKELKLIEEKNNKTPEEEK